MRQIGGRTSAPKGFSTQYTRSGSGRRIATVKYIPGGLMLEVEAPYDKQLVETLTTSIPPIARIWNNVQKQWYIRKDQFDKLTHILDQYCDETLLLNFPKQEVASDNWTRLYLLEGAPIEVIQATYRALAKKHHPDAGGDQELMKEINLAYKALMGELATGD